VSKESGEMIEKKVRINGIVVTLLMPRYWLQERGIKNGL
jgi:hypothetical protein